MISCYTDGSSHQKSHLPGGWAFVIVRDEVPLAANSGNNPCTTNNKMELTAAIEGLKALIAKSWHRTGELTELVSDSMYVLDLACGKSTPTANLELATELRALAVEVGLYRYRWVKGHSGDVWNERCDSLAHDAKNRLLPQKPMRRKEKKALKDKAKKNSQKALEEPPGSQNGS